jgi:hypothetical protein
MGGHTRTELELARESLASTLRKCEKIQDSGKLQPSQKTLNDRRVDALRIAIELIGREIESIDVD